MVAAGPSWSLWAKRLSVRSVRGTRLTRPKHARPDGSSNSYAKHELLDAADSGRARRSRHQDPSDRRRVIPRRDVPAAVEEELPRGAGHHARSRHEPIMLAPGQRDGTAISASPVNRPARIPRFAASNPGASAYARTSRNASSYGTRSGCATVPSSAPRRPRELRNTRGSTGANPRAAIRATDRFGAKGADHSPAGAIAVTDRAQPANAISSATQPPSEIPATSNSAGNRSRSAAASSYGVTDSPPSGGAEPKPGRSTATTSSPNKGSTGSQTRWSAPSGWSRTSVKNGRGSRPSARPNRPRPRRSSARRRRAGHRGPARSRARR